jgi:hypothetical protein
MTKGLCQNLSHETEAQGHATNRVSNPVEAGQGQIISKEQKGERLQDEQIDLAASEITTEICALLSGGLQTYDIRSRMSIGLTE